MPDGIQFLIEIENRMARLPLRRCVLDKEFQGTVHGCLLAGVDKRHARKHIGERGECGSIDAEALEFRAFPRVEVVVGSHVHKEGVGRILCTLKVYERIDGGGGLHGECARLLSFLGKGVLTGSGGYFAEKILHRPIVSHVESMFGEFRLCGFGEHENRTLAGGGLD